VGLLRVIIETKMQETMDASLSELRNQTRANIKKISKEYTTQQADLDRINRDAADVAMQEFRNPLFDTAMRDEKNKTQRQVYQEIKNHEYKIKELKQENEQHAKTIERNEDKLKYYDADDDKAAINEIHNINAKLTTEKNKNTAEIEKLEKEVSELKKTQLED
jgi:predicted nuclease with TOPRIM domain